MTLLIPGRSNRLPGGGKKTGQFNLNRKDMTMPTIADAYPSKYISAHDLQGRDHTVKITHVAAEEVGGKQKYICFFAGKQKGLVLNKTNWNSIVRISGCNNSDDWTGTDVCLFEAYVDFQGDSVPAVRIKAPPQKVGTARPVVRPASADMQGAPAAPRAGNDMDDEIPFAPEYR